MSKKRQSLIFSLGRLSFYWLLLTAVVLIIGGFSGALAGAWSTAPLFFLALFGVLQGAIAPWAIATLLAITLTTVLLVAVWAISTYYEKIRILASSSKIKLEKTTLPLTATAALQETPKNSNQTISITPPPEFPSLSLNTPSPIATSNSNSNSNLISSKIEQEAIAAEVEKPLNLDVLKTDQSRSMMPQSSKQISALPSVNQFQNSIQGAQSTTPPPEFFLSSTTPSPISNTDNDTLLSASVSFDQESKGSKGEAFSLISVSAKDNKLRSLSTSPSKLNVLSPQQTPTPPLSPKQHNSSVVATGTSTKRIEQNTQVFSRVFSDALDKENDCAGTPSTNQKNSAQIGRTPPEEFNLDFVENSALKSPRGTAPETFDLPEIIDSPPPEAAPQGLLLQQQ